MAKKIAIAVGGTGGHTYPAQALTQQLQKIDQSLEILFIGGGLTTNPYFERQLSDAVVDVDYAQPRGVNLWERFKNGCKILKGIIQSFAKLRKFQPDVVVGFGSYHSFPVLAAAWLRRIPVVLYEANTVPGKVIRCFSQYAKVTGLHFDEAAKYLKGKSIELGMPLREGYNSLSLSPNRARQQLGLDSNKFTFLVFGGSQGAFNINLLICSAIVHNLAERSTNYQVIHLVGAQSEVETFKEQYENANIQCLVKGFEPEMNVVWRASDLAICRAGAGTIAELIEMEVPAILIPYLYAADQHQDKNADVLVEQIRGGIKFNERGTDAGVLATEISNLIVNERQLLNQMRYNIKQYKQKKVKRRDLCSVVCEVAGIKER